jgi:GDP-mannose 6-dehydrogenase
MRIAVFGLGYVGLTTAVCLARSGHHVIGIDINGEKVAKANRAISPIVEPGLEDMLRWAIEAERFRAYHSIDGQETSYDIVIVCVGTPSSADGSHSMDAVIGVTRQIATLIAEEPAHDPTVVYRSTFRPGTMDELILPIFRSILGIRRIAAVDLFYNPEFMRESNAINDYFNPPKIVIGSHEGKQSPALNSLYAGFAATAFYTTYREAELTKLVDNSWHALKVAYANEIGRICIHLGVSARIIHEIFVSDTKLNISASYLRPGGAFGGSCLPKDLRALQHVSADLGANTAVIDAVNRSNDAHKHFLFQHCIGDLSPPARVLLIGLAFKAGTDDLRESPAVDLARKMLTAGFELSVYDPTIDATNLVGQNLGYAVVHLPNLAGLLVSEATSQATEYDLVIDTAGNAGHLKLTARRIVSIDALS